jgi:hypothetical protein
LKAPVINIKLEHDCLYIIWGKRLTWWLTWEFTIPEDHMT